MVQITPAEIQSELFPIIAGNGNLTLQLSLGSSKLPFAQSFLHDTVQILSYQTDTPADVVMVAAEIARISISII